MITGSQVRYIKLCQGRSGGSIDSRLSKRDQVRHRGQSRSGSSIGSRLSKRGQVRYRGQGMSFYWFLVKQERSGQVWRSRKVRSGSSAQVTIYLRECMGGWIEVMHTDTLHAGNVIHCAAMKVRLMRRENTQVNIMLIRGVIDVHRPTGWLGMPHTNTTRHHAIRAPLGIMHKHKQTNKQNRDRRGKFI